jgi:hypothetical protein
MNNKERQRRNEEKMANKMTKSEFKKMLKPIVKECIQETLLEGGLLSGIIAEVVKGVTSTQMIVEKKQTKEKHAQEVETEQRKYEEEHEKRYLEKLSETKKKMLDAIGNDSYNGVNLFENTEPMTSAPAPGNSVSPSSPLSAYGSKDSGVNIDGLLGSVGKNWGKLAKGNK